MSDSDYPFWSDEKTPPNQKVEVIAEDVIENTIENINLEDVEAKLTKARTQLILDQPFLGNLVLRLPLKAAGSWCKTSATESKVFITILGSLIHSTILKSNLFLFMKHCIVP